ncbi:D-aminoacyl-tRNA deacylase [Effusibacillus dendaii]|uniref:D-aminoacyl-tRNA deacylase n=1 Tax=Effusibacillus dendaii TaxID=2743772 RepID=A0A7I8DGM2_9BACL|nr:D-aminoacyl-tRNA deacylase [Effusibacillus dendaii]BCJ88139.1 D-aminoacyl-tRNA deacylase [Effusibacillus dendaii]
MRMVVQRASRASVTVEGRVTGAIDCGLVVLVGVTHGDTERDADYLADKLVNLRIFENGNQKMDLSLLDIKGAVLSVSQFTLYGDCRKGRRPNFMDAAEPEAANRLYQYLNDRIRSLGVPVETGVFGAMMQVELVNDGPVTLLLDSKKLF